LLPNLIIILIIVMIGPWIGPALAPFLSFLAVAVHISMSQTNHRYTSHGGADSAAAKFFFSAIQTRDENILSIEGSNSDLWMPFLL